MHQHYCRCGFPKVVTHISQGSTCQEEDIDKSPHISRHKPGHVGVDLDGCLSE